MTDLRAALRLSGAALDMLATEFPDSRAADYACDWEEFEEFALTPSPEPSVEAASVLHDLDASTPRYEGGSPNPTNGGSTAFSGWYVPDYVMQRVRHALRASVEAGAPLDAAWAEAEAALPPDTDLSLHALKLAGWAEAVAGESCDRCGVGDMSVREQASSPAAALRALAVRLREPGS